MKQEKACQICGSEKSILVVNEYMCKSCIKDMADSMRDDSHKGMKDIDIVIEILIDLTPEY